MKDPVYFITTCTYRRQPILTDDSIAAVLVDEWQSARDRHGWVIGRYVIMPDHVHFFCSAELEAKPLAEFVGAWKRWTSRRVHAQGQPRTASSATGRPLWQREFFDHVLRSSESYSEKWNYVRDNPVRAGFVATADDWKHAGEVERLTL
ncbi:MAG: transposase [Chthoniobacterales bacterium]|nr:transposase [Chthoniobacterales bacterium]